MELNDYITINSIPSGVGVYDLTGSRIETVYLNDGYYQMIGARREDRSEYFGRGAAKAIHPDDYGTIVRAAHECIRDNKRMGKRSGQGGSDQVLPPIGSWVGAALYLPELRYGNWKVGAMGAAKIFQKILDYWELKDV